MTVKPVFVNTERLSPAQKRAINKLQDECARRVTHKEIRECFFSKSFGRVLAYESDLIVGQAELFSRQVYFLGKKVLLGGVGGTCVTSSARHRGIGTLLVSSGLSILRARKCDIACLNANVRKYPRGGMYYRLGFRLMGRRVSFEDVHGGMRYDFGELLLASCCSASYRSRRTSEKTFHIGRGYW